MRNSGKDLATWDAIEILANYLKCSTREFGYAGLKDKAKDKVKDVTVDTTKEVYNHRKEKRRDYEAKTNTKSTPEFLIGHPNFHFE